MLILTLALALLSQPAPGADPDPRPVVLTGADAPALLGAAPASVRAFAMRDGVLTPIPVQVDERFVYDLAVVYAGLAPEDCPRRNWCEDLAGHVVELGYADPDTHVGLDPDVTLDADDEIALMLADFGPPVDVIASGAVEVAVTAATFPALASGETRYAYLFAAPEAWMGDAPEPHVAYAPAFARGEYLATYDRAGEHPPRFMSSLYGYPSRQRPASNPETTTLTTAHYAVGFSDRWIMDELRIDGGPDILDVDMVAFGPGVCQRTPYTASLSEGGFLVNRSGPVRAIRRVVGFNSGPLAELQWTFYARYAESRASLRVHRVPGVMNFLDLMPAMHGAVYRSASTPGGALIDGRIDPSVGDAFPSWEIVRGPLAAYAVRHEVSARGFSPRLTTAYRDERQPSVMACLHDREYVGAHGVWVRSKIPNTDPRLGDPAAISLSRRFVFGGDPRAGLAAMDAPLAVEVR
ncbi:hypothetical protein BSZ36_11060 [Rubricoccus marinus]|uniref:Uncharacterized protein n=2 Tax=Rubricoccus marinus TaxID=716817 RepID=A0A259U0C2_9BACT|nr:hypothetical protein BSZ36_11060 [Rubricoccus marinus]